MDPLFPTSAHYSAPFAAPTGDADGSASAPSSAAASASSTPMPTPSGTPVPSHLFSHALPPLNLAASSPHSSPTRERGAVSRAEAPDGTGNKVKVAAARCLFGPLNDAREDASPRCPPLPLAAASAMSNQFDAVEQFLTSPRSSFEPVKKLLDLNKLEVLEPSEVTDSSYSPYPASTYFFRWEIPSRASIFRYVDSNADGIVFKVWDRKDRKVCAFAIFEKGKMATIQGKFSEKFPRRELERSFKFPLGELDDNPILFKEQHCQFLSALLDGAVLAGRFSLSSPDLES